MKVLVICNDLYHWDNVVREGLVPFSGKGVAFTFNCDAEGLKSSDLEGYDVIALCKSDRFSKEKEGSWLTEAMQKSLVSFVERGKGLLVLHAGTTACSSAKILGDLIGCAFSHHPEQCPVEYVCVLQNEITDGVVAFTGIDEHYFIDLTQNDTEVFMESRSRAGIQPAGYRRMQGKGRVCVLTPGHNTKIWLKNEYQTILLSAIRWCGRIKP